MSERDGTPVDVKPRSRDVTDGMQKAPARAMLRAVGMTDDDWDKPQVAIASAWNEVTPCNMTLRKLAERAKEGVRSEGTVVRSIVIDSFFQPSDGRLGIRARRRELRPRHFGLEYGADDRLRPSP